MTTPENPQPLESRQPTTSEGSATVRVAALSMVRIRRRRPRRAPLLPLPRLAFKGPGAKEAWRRLRAQPGRVVSRDEMMRRVREQAQRTVRE